MATITIDGVELPSPYRGLNFIQETMVNSGRNANGVVVGEKVGRMNYKIDIAPLSDYFVVIVKDKKTDELKETFTLNESGADMLRLFCKNKNSKVVSKEIAEMYEAPLDLVMKDVLIFKEKLSQKGLLFE